MHIFLMLLALIASPAFAQRTLTMGLITPPSALDPHFHSTGNNNQVVQHIFDGLVWQDAKDRLQPGLARSWRIIDDTTWEMTLREGVRFHDGTPFEAEDIAFTLRRVPTVPNSPGLYTPFVRNITEVQIIDPTTIRLRTAGAYPFVARDLSSIMILSRSVHAEATTQSFTDGRHAIGTGRYRLSEHRRNERIEFVRNADWWGEAEPWNRVVMRFIPNAGSRVAGLAAGEVDLIDGVPVQDLDRLRTDPRIGVHQVESTGVAFLFPDAVRDVAPFITDKAGRPLDRNPLKDPRVRRAMSMAIARPAIAERLMLRAATAATQFASPAQEDFDETAPALPYDVEGARRLLAEAGYPDGFAITIHGPVGFFTNDDAILQAIAQGFTRVGIATKVEAIVPASLFTRATNREFALFMTTYTSVLAANTLRQVVMTRDTSAGIAPFNRQLYSNPVIDALGSRALNTMDDGARKLLVGQAMRTLNEDMGIIPVIVLHHAWATRKDRVGSYDAAAQGRSQAMHAKPAQ